MTVKTPTWTRCIAVVAALTLRGTGIAATAQAASADGQYRADRAAAGPVDLRNSIAAAAAAGKRFAVVWEQSGCSYCREMETAYFPNPRIGGWIYRHFAIVTLDLHGSRAITDFDGSVHPESALARKYAVHLTPTIQFFPKDPKDVAGRSGPDIEVERMPGLLEAKDFLAMFQWVADGHGEDFGTFSRRQAEAGGNSP